MGLLFCWLQINVSLDRKTQAPTLHSGLLHPLSSPPLLTPAPPLSRDIPTFFGTLVPPLQPLHPPTSLPLRVEDLPHSLQLHRLWGKGERRRAGEVEENIINCWRGKGAGSEKNREKVAPVYNLFQGNLACESVKQEAEDKSLGLGLHSSGRFLLGG